MFYSLAMFSSVIIFLLLLENLRKENVAEKKDFPKYW